MQAREEATTETARRTKRWPAAPRGPKPVGRIMPRGLEKVNKAVINPVARLFAGKVPPWALLTHTGRKSGREYTTPLQGYRKNALMAFPLAYGENTDWARNVLGGGGAKVLYRGTRFIAVDPAVLDRAQAEELDLPRLARAASRAMKILVVTLRPDDERPGRGAGPSSA